MLAPGAEGVQNLTSGTANTGAIIGESRSNGPSPEVVNAETSYETNPTSQLQTIEQATVDKENSKRIKTTRALLIDDTRNQFADDCLGRVESFTNLTSGQREAARKLFYERSPALPPRALLESVLGEEAAKQLLDDWNREAETVQSKRPLLDVLSSSIRIS